MSECIHWYLNPWTQKIAAQARGTDKHILLYQANDYGGIIYYFSGDDDDDK